MNQLIEIKCDINQPEEIQMSEHDGVKLPPISVQTLKSIVVEFDKDPAKVVAECKLSVPLFIGANLVGGFDPIAFTAGFVTALYYVGHEDLLPEVGIVKRIEANLELDYVRNERLIADASKHSLN